MSKRTRWQPPYPAKDVGKSAQGKTRDDRGPRLLRLPEAMLEPEQLWAHGPELEAIDAIIERTQWCIWPGCGRFKQYELMVCKDHRQFIIDYIDPPTRRMNEQIEALRRQKEANVAAVERGEKIAKDARVGVGGYVYFVRVDDLIKIGYSTQPYQRLRAYPPNAEVLGVFPGTKKLERDLHGRFRFALRKGREWFRVADEILEYVNEMVAHYGPPDKALTDRYQDPGPRQKVGTRNWRGTKKTAA